MIFFSITALNDVTSFLKIKDKINFNKHVIQQYAWACMTPTGHKY